MASILDLRLQFNLPEVEQKLCEYPCTYKSTKSLKGRIYLTYSYFLFKALDVSNTTSNSDFKLKLTDITHVEKVKAITKSRKGIKIATKSGEMYAFKGFENRSK